MIITNNKKLYEDIYSFKNHGRKKKGVFIHNKIGYNFMFTELQAAMGLAQLDKLKRIIKLKLKLYKKYTKALSSINNIKFIEPTSKSNQIHWFTNILCKKVKLIKLIKFLNKKNIQTRRAFYPLHMQPCYKNNKNIIIKDKFPNSIETYKKLISLPSASQLKMNDMNYVIHNIKKFFKK